MTFKIAYQSQVLEILEGTSLGGFTTGKGCQGETEARAREQGWTEVFWLQWRHLPWSQSQRRSAPQQTWVGMGGEQWRPHTDQDLKACSAAAACHTSALGNSSCFCFAGEEAGQVK